MAKRYQRGNQKPYIEEEQTTQCIEDNKGVIRNRISKKNKQHNVLKIPQGQSETVYRRRTDNTMAKRYQRSNQKPYIEEEQTTQCLEDTKVAIRNRISKKNRQHNGQKIPKEQSETYIEEEQTTQWPKDTKGAIRNRISKKNRQHNVLKIPKWQSETVYRRRTDNTMAKRYQRSDEKPYFEEQTTQWPKDTKGVIRNRISKKNRQHNVLKIPKGQSETVY